LATAGWTSTDRKPARPWPRRDAGGGCRRCTARWPTTCCASRRARRPTRRPGAPWPTPTPAPPARPPRTYASRPVASATSPGPSPPKVNRSKRADPVTLGPLGHNHLIDEVARRRPVVLGVDQPFDVAEEATA